MDVFLQQASPLTGALTVPPDKAICHRALLIAAVAEGTTEIRPWPEAEDCQRTLEVVQRLGVAVRRSGDGVRLEGGRLRAPSDDLFCGESGTTLRLAAGLLAGQPFVSRLTAGPSLSRRPMRRIVEPLARMGARLEGASATPEAAEVYPPVTIHGRRPLRAIRYEMPIASAQVKSAVLLAALGAEGRTTVVEPQPTRDHTERLLRRCGLRLASTGGEVSLEPGAVAAPGALTLPGDFSSAAFFIVAAACVAGSRLTLQDVGLNPTRLGLLAVLSRMGAGVVPTVTGEGWEPRGTVVVDARPLHGTVVEAREVPLLIDELPILMVAAACAEGITRFLGVGELRVKETDRIRSMAEGLGRLGARVRVTAPDEMEIAGGRLQGAVVESVGDHRTAMSLAVAGLAASGTTTLQGAECVGKSFPDFFERLRQAGPSPTGKTVDKP